MPADGASGTPPIGEFDLAGTRSAYGETGLGNEEAGETVEAWQPDRPVPLRFTFDNAARLFDEL